MATIKPEDLTGLTDEQIQRELDETENTEASTAWEFRFARRIEAIVTDSVGGAWAKACAVGVRIAGDLAIAQERKARGHVASCGCRVNWFNDREVFNVRDYRCAPPDKPGGERE